MCSSKNSVTWLLRSALQKPPIDSTNVAAHPGRDLGLYPGPVLLHVLPGHIPRATVPHLELDQAQGILVLYLGGQRIIQSADDQRWIAETRQGLKSLDAKLRIAGWSGSLAATDRRMLRLRFAPRR